MIRRTLAQLPVQILLAFLVVVGLFYGFSRLAGALDRWWLVLLADLVLAYVALQALLFLFAQFVLPVRTWDERRKAFQYLKLYLRGRHGPVVFIKNGRLVAKPRELQKKGPGVILLDSASAAVLRTSPRYTRVIGPGIAFTHGGETLLKDDIVDLRIQSRKLRPPEDPFPNNGPRDIDPRSYNTHGVTRDGIEVVPDIQVVFQLVNHNNYPSVAQDPLVKTPFGFYRQSVWRAVVRQPIDSNEQTTQKIIPWTELPARLAADLWREYIRQVSLEDLFGFEPGEPSTLSLIINRIQARMTQEATTHLAPRLKELFEDRVGKHREFRLLMERGILVQAVRIGNLRFGPTVRDGLIKRWEHHWAEIAEQEKRHLDQVENQTRLEGARQGSLYFLHRSSDSLRRAVLAGPPDLKDAVCLVVEDLREMIQRDPDLQASLTPEDLDLLEILTVVQNRP